MILIPTTVAPSPIHGLGLFAGCKVPRGAVVSVWNPSSDLACNPALVEQLPEPIRSTCRHYGYVDRGGFFRFAAGPERYINHSDEPNLIGDPVHFRIALRDIEKGEELVEDYTAHGTDWR